MPSPTQIKGTEGETIALRYLEAKGYQYVTRHWHCRGGEIDLIMRDRDELVFVEVKMRANNAIGHPEEMVDWKKKKRLLHAANQYLQFNQEENDFWRIDIVAITGTSDIAHFSNVVENNRVM